MSILYLQKKLHPEFSKGKSKPSGSVEIDSSVIGKALQLYHGFPHDAVTGKRSPASLTTSKILGDGSVFFADGNPANYIDVSNDTLVASNYTIFAYLKCGNLTGTEVWLGNTSGASVWWGRTGATQYFSMNGPTISGGTLTTTKFHAVCVRRTGTSYDLFLDGALVASGTNAMAPSSVRTTLGRFGTTANYDFHGNVKLFWSVNRPLSNAQIKQLSQDPFSVLKPSLPHIYLVAATGSAPVISSVEDVIVGNAPDVIFSSDPGTITAIAFGSASGTSLTQNSATNWEAVVPLNCGVMYGASINVTATNSSGTSDPTAKTFLPRAGWSYTTFTNGYAGQDSASLVVLAGLTGVVATDQITFETTDDQGGTVSIDASTGLVSSTAASNVDKSFDYAIRDASDTQEGSSATWVLYASVPVMAADTSATPNEGTTAVGTYAVTNTANPNVVYSLSGTDAADFNINSSTGAVTAKVAYDYETKSTYSIAVVATLPEGTDSQTITINVQNVNESPTDISLSSTTVSETGGLNAVVGFLSTTDPDSGDSHTYTLVAGTGDTDNASFNISGSNLRCNDPGTLGVGTYSVRIQTDDGVSTPFAKAFTINVVVASEQFGVIVSICPGIIGKLVN